MSYCLIPDLVEKFKKALKSGEIDPFKLADMDSASRRDFLAKYVGQENAKQVNALFESKLLLKNQQKGMVSWAKRVAGISPEVRRDLLSRIEKMDKVLSPEEGKLFLEDLASTRLKIDVSQEEAQNIENLSKQIKETRSKVREDGTFATEDGRLAYGMAKVNMENYINELKLQSRKISFREEPVRKIVTAIGEIPGTMKSLVASLDNSFWGRQGIKTLLDVRTSKIWLKNFLKSWKDLAQQTFSKGEWYKSGDDSVLDMIKADVYSRPNAINGKYRIGGYGLDVLSEEAYPSSLPERIPALGRLFKASEVAYNGGALRLRADLADRIISIAEKNGVNTLNKEEAVGLGHLVGSLTGRGSLGKGEALAKEANVLLFSIKFLKSNIDTLTAHQFDSKATKFSKSEARKNLVSMIASVATVTALAGLIDPESVDPDPRSTNFGKIKVFGNWVDITGGMAGLVRLISYITPTYHNGKWSLWRKTSTGNWVDMRSGAFGVGDAYDALIDGLFTNKLAPVASLVRDALRGEMFGGEEFNLKNAVKNLTIPLSVQNFKDIAENPDSSFVLGSMILEGLGFSTNTYKYKSNWKSSTGKEMTQFREKVGEEQFQKANDDYDKAYSNWYSIATQSKEFKQLSDEKRADLITKAKEQIKKQIFEEYGFEYTKEPKTQEEIDEEGVMDGLLPDEIKNQTSRLIDNVNNMISKIKLVPEVLASNEDKMITSIRVEGDTVITSMKDKDGKFSERYSNIDHDIGIIGSTIGKMFDSIGRKLGLPESNVSELFGYEDKERRIAKMLEYSKEFENKVNTYVEEKIVEQEEKIKEEDNKNKDGDQNLYDDPKAIDGKGRNTSKNRAEPLDDVAKAIRQASKEFGVKTSLLFDIADAESDFIPNKVNLTPEGKEAGNPTGLFQFTNSTWEDILDFNNNPKSSLYKKLPNTDRSDPLTNALAGAYLIKFGQLGKWDASEHDWGNYWSPQELEELGYYDQTVYHKKGVRASDRLAQR